MTTVVVVSLVADIASIGKATMRAAYTEDIVHFILKK